jgi:mRNA interferase MazF
MKKGEIWLVELPTTNGHEQEGYRPAMVLAEAEANIAIIVPFTSNLQALRFPDAIEVKPSNGNGLSAISVALIFQVRAIDKKRLKTKIGELETQLIKNLDAILKRLLSL